jgi:hypothetical protein
VAAPKSFVRGCCDDDFDLQDPGYVDPLVAPSSALRLEAAVAASSQRLHRPFRPPCLLEYLGSLCSTGESFTVTCGRKST